MEFKSLDSSNIDGVHYDPQSQVMTVEFTNKSRHEYTGVPDDVHEDFLNADSAGRFFHSNIKGKYKSTKIA